MPLLGRFHQPSLHRITMHTPQFLPLLGGSHVEVVEAGLPKCSALRLVSEQNRVGGGCSVCAWVTRREPYVASTLASPWKDFQPRVQSKKCGRLRHDDVADHHEPIPLACLLQSREKAVAAARCSEKAIVVAGTSDKVQVMGAVSAMQTARHDKQNSTGSTAARPCKERKDGAPRVLERERGTWKAGPPVHLQTSRSNSEAERRWSAPLPVGAQHGANPPKRGIRRAPIDSYKAPPSDTSVS